MVLSDISGGIELTGNELSFLAGILISILFYYQYKKYEEEQGKRHTFIGRIEEQRGEEFEYCYWFCAILQERQLGVISWGRAGS